MAESETPLKRICAAHEAVTQVVDFLGQQGRQDLVNLLEQALGQIEVQAVDRLGDIPLTQTPSD